MRAPFATALAAVVSGTLLATPAATGPDNTQGVAVLAATIATNVLPSILLSGTGVVSAERVSTGASRITFNRNVSACTYQATLRNPPTTGVPPLAGFVTVTSVFDKPATVAVATRTVGGALFDTRFDLLVFCAS